QARTAKASRTMPPSHDQGRAAGTTADGGEAGPAAAWSARRAPAAAPAPGRRPGPGRRPPPCPCLRRATAQRLPRAGGTAIEVLTRPRIATRVKTVNSRRTSEIGDNRSQRSAQRTAAGCLQLRPLSCVSGLDPPYVSPGKNHV